MEDSLKKALESIGVNVEKTLERFLGKEDLYMKFLKKFLEDHSYDMLIQNITETNYEEAFKCSHTIKGVAANLGLTYVADSSGALTEELRNFPYDKEKIKEYLDCLRHEYENTTALIKTI